MAEGRDWTVWINVAGSLASLTALGYIWGIFGDDGKKKHPAFAGLGAIPADSFRGLVSEYGGSHRPSSEGPPLDNLLAPGSYAPADVYEHPEWYTASEWAGSVGARIRDRRGKEKAHIWRAGPKAELNTGDWVAITEDYAKLHRRSTDPSYQVCKWLVKADDVRWAGDDLAEWGYFGPPKTRAIKCFRGKKKKALAGLPKTGRIPMATARRALARLPKKSRECAGMTAAALREGMEIEREHRDVTHGTVGKTAKIAAAHICESGTGYYKGLKKLERRLKANR